MSDGCKMMSIEEVSKLLSVDTDTISTMIQAGELQALSVVGGAIRIPESSVLRFFGERVRLESNLSPEMERRFVKALDEISDRLVELQRLLKGVKAVLAGWVVLEGMLTPEGSIMKEAYRSEKGHSHV